MVELKSNSIALLYCITLDDELFHTDIKTSTIMFRDNRNRLCVFIKDQIKSAH